MSAIFTYQLRLPTGFRAGGGYVDFRAESLSSIGPTSARSTVCNKYNNNPIFSGELYNTVISGKIPLMRCHVSVNSTLESLHCTSPLQSCPARWQHCLGLSAIGAAVRAGGWSRHSHPPFGVLWELDAEHVGRLVGAQSVVVELLVNVGRGLRAVGGALLVKTLRTPGASTSDKHDTTREARTLAKQSSMERK